MAYAFGGGVVVLFCARNQRKHARCASRRNSSKAMPAPKRPWMSLRACLKTTRGAAAKDFGCGQGGEVGASPQRAVTTEPTPATDKRPAARRVFSKRPSGFVAPQSKTHQGYSPSSRLAIRPFAGKQHPRVVFKQALTRIFHSVCAPTSENVNVHAARLHFLRTIAFRHTVERDFFGSTERACKHWRSFGFC